MGVLIELFITLAKIGLFTFGGGYAMISIIEDECVEKKHWLTHEEMMNLTVIAESTPGPIAINCATFVGYKKAKLIGAIVGTVAMVLPSFTIIYIISKLLDNFLDIGIIARMFKGIKLSVGVMILLAGINMARKMPRKPLMMGIMAVSFLVMLGISLFGVNVSAVYLMVVAGALNLIIFTVREKIIMGGSK